MYAGAKGSYLVSNIIDELQLNNVIGGTKVTELTEFNSRQNGLIEDTRQTFNLGAEAGMGILGKWGRNYIRFKLSYTWWMRNQINAGKRFDLPELNFQYAYVDDDMIFHNLTFTVGIVFPQYPQYRRQIKKIRHENKIP